LISDDDEVLTSEVLQQLFGKVSLAVDWMQWWITLLIKIFLIYLND
jgi:hypothetical protein